MKQAITTALRKPTQSLLKNRLALVGILLVSIASGFFIYRSFASTTPSDQISLEGRLETVYKDDFAGKKSTQEYMLVSAGGARTKLNLASKTDNLTGQPRVSVKGTLKNGELVVAKATDTTVLQKSAKTVPQTPHKTAVVLYNFSDNRSEPISPADVRAKVFEAPNSANVFFKEESFGARTLTGIENPQGDVFGYVTIAETDTGCLNRRWSETATSMLKAQGHNLDAYDNVIFMATSESCGYGGRAEVYGRLSWVFLNAANSPDVAQPIVEHELTHNFGTWHANTYECISNLRAKTPLSDNCTVQEYGDPYDVMGYNIYAGHTYHSSSYFLAGLGWLPSTAVKPVTASGDYTVRPQGYSAATTKALRITRAYDQNNLPEYLYVEYRQPFGIFDNFAAGDEATKGAMIRVANKYALESYALQFPHKATASTPAYTSTVLHDGEVVTDATHGLTIKQISHNANSVVLRIDQPNVPQPDTTPPTPPASISRTLGSTKVTMLQWPRSPEADVHHYEVLRDGASIGEVLATKQATVYRYEDWTSLAVGNHTYQVRAVDYTGNVSLATSATFVTAPADTVKPSAPTDLTYSKYTPVSGSNASGWNYSGARLSWKAATDNQRVMGYIVTRKTSKGTTTFDTRQAGGSTSATSFIDYQLPGASVTYSVQTYDADLNMSPTSKSITIKAPQPNRPN